MENAVAPEAVRLGDFPCGEGGPPLEAVIFGTSGDETDALATLVDQACPTGAQTHHFSQLENLTRHLASHAVDIIFCASTNPAADTDDLVQQVVEAARLAPVVLLVDSDQSPATGVGLRSGAKDYLVKGTFDSGVLARTLRYAMVSQQAETENRRIERDLHQLRVELDQYVGVVAHDLRAPIRTARLFADRLCASVGSQDGANSAALAQGLDESLEQLEGTVTSLLRLGALRDNSIDPVVEPVAKIVADVRAQLADEIAASEATVTCTADGTVLADPALIRELLAALVKNSLTFRQPDRRPIVEIAVSNSGQFTSLDVSDNGLGVEPQYRVQAFRLFEQVHKAPDSRGLGFGLAFCQRVAELHGGSLEFIDPPDNVGALLRLLLPADPAVV